MQGAGDNGFEQVALPHLPVVYRVALRLARDPHLAEDLVQETYLRAHKGFASFRMREFGIRPWLLRILQNVYLNVRTRERRAPKVADRSDLDLLQVRAGNDENFHGALKIDFEQVDDRVKAAVESLRPEYRDVLLLWATMELSYQEIADTLEIPIGTVMSRLYRARQHTVNSLRDYAAQQRVAPVPEAQA